MPVFAANLTMMFNEWPFLDRFDAAADAGFTAVEFLFPYEPRRKRSPSGSRATACPRRCSICPPGDWAAGERGIAALPGAVR